jgi:peptide/nickel transport system substrate-binding protein
MVTTRATVPDGVAGAEPARRGKGHLFFDDPAVENRIRSRRCGAQFVTGSTSMRRLVGIGAVVAVVTLGASVAQVAAQDEPVTLTIGLMQDMSSPNVAVGYLVADFETWNLQYSTLTDKAADDFETIPGLAESWETSDDGMTYTYTLREGLLWSDGEPLTAEDVVYTINRSRDEEWYNHYSTVANLDAVALDERTVQITSSVPDPKLPTMDVYIVPKHIYETLETYEDVESYDGMDGVASGQYRLVEWRSGQDWTMERNPNWWGRDNGIDRIVFRLFTNADAMAAALQRGEIDAAHNVSANSVAQLEADPDIVVVPGLQGGFTELAMNGGESGIGDGHPALQDIRVRHAIFQAIDRNVLFERVALGLGEVGTTLSPSADTSWIPDLGDENWSYDPEAAVQLLDEAGYVDADGDGVRDMPDGSRPLEFRIVEKSGSTQDGPLREFISGWLEDIGIATVVEVKDDDQLTTDIENGNFDMFIWGWVPYVDPDPMLSYMTCDHITYDPEEPGWNDGNWCSEEYDALYEQQKVELDEARRREIVAEMLRLFNREATYLVLLLDPDIQAYRTDRFEGWTQQPADVGPVLFTNSSPTYANLSVIGAEPTGGDDAGGGDGTATDPGGSGTDDGGAATGGPDTTAGSADDDDGGSNTGLIIGIVVAAVVVVAAVAFAVSRRSSADDRE